MYGDRSAFYAPSAWNRAEQFVLNPPFPSNMTGIPALQWPGLEPAIFGFNSKARTIVMNNDLERSATITHYRIRLNPALR